MPALGPISTRTLPDAIAAESKPTEKERRAPEHLALGLTLLAVGFVGLRILIVSRGDSDTLRALVQNLNVTAIVLATILPVVTTAALLLLVMGILAVLIPDEVLSPGKKKVSPAAVIFFIAFRRLRSVGLRCR